MTLSETVRTALEAMASRRLRSALTMLGILIGIAAVILTVGLGQGAQAQVQAQIGRLGSNLLIVAPGSSTSSTGFRGGRGTASTLTGADAAALASPVAVPDVARVASTSTSSQPLTAGTVNWTTTVVGTTPSWATVRARDMSEGRFLTDADVADARQVTVLGQETASQLFGVRSAVGQTVTVSGSAFTVVGVLSPLGATATGNEDDQALVPATTFAQRGSSRAVRGTVSLIYLQATSPDALSSAYQEAQALLLARHGLTAAGADFTVSSQQSLLTAATATRRTLTLLLGGVAAISLLVGGIGVMNIMFVSVTERVREIGLRKALGATPAAVRRQFLVEASALGATGGVLGLGLAVAGAAVLQHVMAQPVPVSPVAAVGAVTVSLVIGVVAGVYPAGRAAALPPIDALRND